MIFESLREREQSVAWVEFCGTLSRGSVPFRSVMAQACVRFDAPFIFDLAQKPCNRVTWETNEFGTMWD